VKRGICAFVALLLVIDVNCVRVIEENSESTTKFETSKKSENENESTDLQTTVKAPESLVELVPRIIDYHATTASTSTEAADQTIPPTLVNAKHEGSKDVTEANYKDLR
jgi:hypothetical protein